MSFPLSVLGLVTPAALPSNNDELLGLGRVSGFGLRFDADRGWVLNFDMQTATVTMMDEPECRSRLDQKQELVAASHICTDNGPRMCFGHLGNGLTMQLDSNDEGVETLVGVVSVITNMCHEHYPVMFTKVALYTEWIQEYIDSI